MSSMESSKRVSEGDLVAATWIFEQIALRDGLHVDRSRVRRAVDEAAETFFGVQEGGWWAGLWKQGILLVAGVESSMVMHVNWCSWPGTESS